MADQTVDQFLSLGPSRRQVPTIQQLGKNNKAHPPGHTPIGSVTDFTALDTDADEPPALINSNSTTVPENEAEDIHDHRQLSHLTTPGGAVDGDDEEEEEPRMRSPPSPAPERKKQESMRLKDSNSNIIVPPSSSTTLADDESFVNFMHQDVWNNMSKSLTPLVANLSNRRTRSFSTLRRRQPRNLTSEDSITPASSRVATTTTGTDSEQSFVRQYYNFGNFGSLTSSNISEPLSQGGQSQVSSSFSVKAARKREQDYPNLNKVINKLQETEVFFDREAAVRGLKQRILKGERVTHEEIKAIRNLTVSHSQRHRGYRLPWSKDLYCVKGLVHIPTPNKPSPLINSFASTDDLRIPIDDKITLEHWGRRQYVLNLAGFNDEDISLYLEGKNKLVIRAVRPDRRDHPAMSVTETIMLPPDLAADNLRIARMPNGTTIIEESWRF